MIWFGGAYTPVGVGQMRNPALDSLAATIDAIGTDRFYPSLCGYLRECLGFDNVIVLIFVGSNVPHVAYKKIFGPDVFRYLDEQYLSGAYLLDPVYHFHLRHGEAGLYHLLDVAPDQFRSSRYYKWYYGRIGITDEISIILPVAANATITISMGKDGSSGSTFSQKMEDNLRQHEPVAMAVLKAHWSALGTPGIQIARPTSLTESLREELRCQHGMLVSARQAEVALLILQGHSSPSIGLQLGVSPQTVKVFRKQLYSRCRISSQAELFALLMPILGKANTSKAGWIAKEPLRQAD